ncbi:dimethylarginine dimethylaminohydrolase family protein [Aliikangiella sp. G2MR2-5]|uniref:dimethylarginine dimethylaminohydrolase family protein n=1 Tax=Aliikangiella sp. G2MR2-5 TaxID=2788943 RepID=UPI0018AB7C5E|nr:arginine deiminase-related protein [Aliikangiella sp. G2MR2-5]
MFTKAIVRTPCHEMVKGITSANLGAPIYEKALAQHADYIEALIECGLDVTILPPDEGYPDSCFVEDVALMTPHCAIITNPGADSRKGEIESMIPAVEEFYDKVEFIEAPGTVEAGDIMMVGDHFYIGLSDRTNEIGAVQMISYLEKYGMSGSMVEMSEMLHLKTGLSYLENNKLLATGEFVAKEEFQKFDMIEIDNDEAYASNSVWINDTILTPNGFPKTKAKLEQTGYKIREVDVSEFQKLDGGLSCLSLRF